MAETFGVRGRGERAGLRVLKKMVLGQHVLREEEGKNQRQWEESLQPGAALVLLVWERSRSKMVVLV